MGGDELVRGEFTGSEAAEGEEEVVRDELSRVGQR